MMNVNIHTRVTEVYKSIKMKSINMDIKIEEKLVKKLSTTKNNHAK